MIDNRGGERGSERVEAGVIRRLLRQPLPAFPLLRRFPVPPRDTCWATRARTSLLTPRQTMPRGPLDATVSGTGRVTRGLRRSLALASRLLATSSRNLLQAKPCASPKLAGCETSTSYGKKKSRLQWSVRGLEGPQQPLRTWVSDRDFHFCLGRNHPRENELPRPCRGATERMDRM